jgi:hypothetical protein
MSAQDHRKTYEMDCFGEFDVRGLALTALYRCDFGMQSPLHVLAVAVLPDMDIDYIKHQLL